MIAVLGAGTSQGADLAAYAKLGEFRKATPNMLLAHAAITATLGGRTLPPSTAMVLGSSLGELDVTQEFLTTVGATGVARPLLFQSSLHNATLGFLTLKLGITGPTFTVSCGVFTGERALQTAMHLLQGGIAEHCLVVGVERASPALAEPMALLDSGKSRQDGAGALWLTRPEHAGEARAWILDVDCKGSSAESREPSRNPSDAVERLAEKIIQGPTLTAARALALTKPDGESSVIRWSLARP